MTKELFKWVAAVGIVVALPATPAQAQANRISFGVGGGVAIPLGNYSDATETGWDITGAVQVKPATSPVGFQADGAFQENKLDPSSFGKDRWIYGTANVVFWLPVSEETRIRPYILGGGGIYHLKTTVNTDIGVPSQTKFGINAGAGVDFELQSALGAFLEGRFHDVLIDGPDARFIPINVGLRFHTK